MRAGLAGMGLPADLVQVVPQPVDRARTQALMRAVDLIVCTGSQTNVREAYRSGTPAIGVGAGNVPVIVDESADLAAAAARIARSKCFDNATSCSSENALVLLDEIYAEAIAALEREGGYLCSAAERARLEAALFQGGKLSRELVAKDAAVIAARVGLADETEHARFFMVEETGIGQGHPFSGEKLSLVLAVYRARDFAHAKALCRAILEYQGRGHSVGIHTRLPERAQALAAELDVVRVLVNQAHTFGNGGGFDNGLPFTLSMGCGTWAGNSISENLNLRHFINVTHLVTTIAEDRPSEEALFGPYWRRYG
jgi:sulfoacetaldehyde dehydrogenase